MTAWLVFVNHLLHFKYNKRIYESREIPETDKRKELICLLHTELVTIARSCSSNQSWRINSGIKYLLFCSLMPPGKSEFIWRQTYWIWGRSQDGMMYKLEANAGCNTFFVSAFLQPFFAVGNQSCLTFLWLLLLSDDICNPLKYLPICRNGATPKTCAWFSKSKHYAHPLRFILVHWDTLESTSLWAQIQRALNSFDVFLPRLTIPGVFHVLQREKTTQMILT